MLQKSCIALLVVLAFAFPSATRADVTDKKVTLSANTTLDLETGATGSTGGDILWSGSNMAPDGSATLFNIGNLPSGEFDSLTQSVVSAFPYFPTPIPGSSLVVGDVFAVHTNGGHYAAVLVTATSGTSISLEYTTFGASTGPGGPSITQVLNNYGLIPSGLPNYGIAPGSLFIIQGTGLNSQPPSALLSSAAPGLQTTVNGTSISVTVNGTTTHPVIYYTSATQVDAVLPSNTPVGTGTVTLTNGSQTSSPVAIQVVASAFGIDTLSGTGGGTGVAQDLNGNVITVTSSASPGQILTFWGSGVGADPNNDDKLFPQNLNNLTNIPLTFYIGGLPANITYRGRSQYPGVDVVVITVPPNVQPGCNVSVETVSGKIVSNFVTLPVAVGGGACSDANSYAGGLNPTLLQVANAKGALSSGVLLVATITNEGGTNGTKSEGILSGNFQKTIYAAVINGNIAPSLGSCVVTQFPSLYTPPANSTVGLDAGKITVATPMGPYTLYQVPMLKGTYDLAFLPGGPSSPAIVNDGTVLLAGTYTFTASGGTDVGAFSTSLNYPETFIWTNDSSITSIDRTQPLTITWSGGTAGAVVVMHGQSTTENATGASFECFADATAGSFTIPNYVLLALPPSSTSEGVVQGTLGVLEYFVGNQFSATGLDYGLMDWARGTERQGVTYQ